MKKVWKIVLPLCAAVILIGAGVFLYFNHNASVENPFLPLDDTSVVTGFYTTERPEYLLPDSFSEYYVTESRAPNQFCLTKKQKIKINRWLVEHKLEERNNIYQKDFKYKYSYGVTLRPYGAPSLTLKQFEYEEGRQLKSLYALEMWVDGKARYEITKEEYDEFFQLIKKIDLVNESKQMDIMDWRQMEPKAVLVSAPSETIALSQEQLEEIQTFFNGIDDKLTPGYLRTYDDYLYGGGAVSSDLIFANDENCFHTYASIGHDDVGRAIHVEGLDNMKAYYAVDEETWKAYQDMVRRFYDSAYPTND